MTKKELIEMLSTVEGVSKTQAGNIIARFLLAIQGDIEKRGRCAVPGLGVFKKVHRVGRLYPKKPFANLDTKRPVDLVEVPKHNTVIFRACPNLKARVNR